MGEKATNWAWFIYKLVLFRTEQTSQRRSETFCMIKDKASLADWFFALMESTWMNGNYCELNKNWKSSRKCKAVGIEESLHSRRQNLLVYRQKLLRKHPALQAQSYIIQLRVWVCPEAASESFSLGFQLNSSQVKNNYKTNFPSSRQRISLNLKVSNTKSIKDSMNTERFPFRVLKSLSISF